MVRVKKPIFQACHDGICCAIHRHAAARLVKRRHLTPRWSGPGLSGPRIRVLLSRAAQLAAVRWRMID